MVIIMTLVFGISSLIFFVAASPSITGILTSMRTRSGKSSLQRFRAWWPSLASAITSMPSSPESKVLRPSLTRAWSSAIRMRAVFVGATPSLFRTVLPPLTIHLDGRCLCHHFGAFSRPAVDFQVAAQQCHPLAHAREAQTLARPAPVGRFLRVKAGAPIPHVEANRVVQAPKCDLYSGAGSMLVDVGESLLCDPKWRSIDLWRQTFVSKLFLVVDLGAFA